MGQRDREFVLDLSEYSEAEREAIALEVIDKIIKRTKAGKDKDGNPLAPYSKDYKESLNFKIAGKSGRVNLTLSGDMLDSLEIIENYGNGKVKIGYSSGNPEGGKAEGNILGTYGQDTKVGPARDFLGIAPDELDSVLKKYPPESEKAARRAKERLLTEKAANRLSGKIDLDALEVDDE